MYHNRKIKVFKVASPIFLMICLVGCGIMYLEMAAIFPILDTKSCVATKVQNILFILEILIVFFSRIYLILIMLCLFIIF